MGITTLTFSDEANGRLFAAWVGELLYSVGQYADFDKLSLPSVDEIVLSLVCLPASFVVAAKAMTKRKRSDGEFWSTVYASYDAFTQDGPRAKIDCIKVALVDAVRQLPDSHMPNSVKEQVLTAISSGAASLCNEPGRHPR